MVERTFRADEKVPLAKIDKREMQYLYREGARSCSWTTTPTTRSTSRRPTSAARVDYLKKATPRSSTSTRTTSSPPSSPLRSSSPITATEPGVQGDRVSGARKPATVETGLVVQVPLFVETGEKIKVDTRTGEYLARA